ncbi:hypothetical protein K523DRAFT_358801 [Schizophyllum commune Tattone D]|nr:hypothetical protein K523DRAFT_358801 [Schizophyllum commune Tattone D]
MATHPPGAREARPRVVTRKPEKGIADPSRTPSAPYVTSPGPQTMVEGEEGGDRGDTCPDPLLSGESHAFTGGAIRKSRSVSDNIYRKAYTRTCIPLRARLDLTYDAHAL